MPLQIILGGAACGKTTEVLKQIRSELSAPELKRIWLILPDRRQINSIRKKLVASGSILGVSTGLFYEFGNEILLKSDQNFAEASEPLLQRIVLELVNKFSQSEGLGELERITDTPGFIEVIHKKIA